jgi:molecular chaperone DnaK (HSP70)
VTAVGIDFGTTNCVLAAFTAGKPEPITIDTPPDDWARMGFDKVLPSVFALNGEQPLFGWAAKRASDGLQAVKRLLATEDSVSVGDRTFLVDEVVALMFGHLKRAAAESGFDFDQAVVTIPANSRGPARYRTKICAGLSGIEVLTLINEPTAAAMAFGLQAAGEQTILVYDFGGGTLDVTLLEAQDGTFFEQASKGIRKMGGLDMDKALGRKILETVPGHDSWGTAQKTAFWLAVERAKILLSTQEETNVELPNGEYHRVTRKMFEDAVRPLIERTREPILQCLADMRMQPSAIDALVLVGGTSKVPAVRAFVSEVVAQEPAGRVDPMTAVGEGAAIAAAIMTGQLQTSDYFVSTEHALGTVVANFATRSMAFDEIIPRNHKIPAKETQIYKPVFDDQESLHVVVMEGDMSKPLDDPDNVLIWESVVQLPEPRPMAEASFELTYEYDVDGIVYVTMRDIERDRVVQPLDHYPIPPSGMTKDPRELVNLAGRVKGTIETGGLQDAGGQPPVSNGDPQTRELIEKARSKVIPFLDDAQARVLQELVDAVESAVDGQLDDAKRALEAELRKYSYLL